MTRVTNTETDVRSTRGGGISAHHLSREAQQGSADRIYRIVVVDDQEEIRNLLVEMLEPEGYDMTVAASLADLRTLLANMPIPDLILMDLKLGTDPHEGMRVIRRFREQFNVTASPDFIVISGYGDTEILTELLRIDTVRDFIPKQDFHVTEVRLRVRRALRDMEKTREAGLDPLLRIPNRGMLERRLNEGLAQWSRYLRKSIQDPNNGCAECWDLSFVLMDIDDFSTFNNRYGHRAGDEVLVRAAGGMASRLRAGDFIARYGGEELAIIMPLTGFLQARQVVDRIAWEVSGEPYAPRQGVEEVVTFSAGIATLTFELCDSREFLHALRLATPRGDRKEESQAIWKLKEHLINAADWALREVKDLKNLSGGRRTAGRIRMASSGS